MLLQFLKEQISVHRDVDPFAVQPTRKVNSVGNLQTTDALGAGGNGLCTFQDAVTEIVDNTRVGGVGALDGNLALPHFRLAKTTLVGGIEFRFRNTQTVEGKLVIFNYNFTICPVNFLSICTGGIPFCRYFSVCRSVFVFENGI